MQDTPAWLAAFIDALAPEYVVQRVLGRGGMATVLLADEPALKRQVAIKVLDPALARDATARARFRREAEAAAGLSHPHIVAVHRVGEAGELPYLVMQYVRGETLADRLSREQSLPVAEALRIAREVASALRAAHRRGIVHRDVKPQNVLLETDDGRALVSDFGIVRFMSPESTDETLTRDALTGDGHAIGTPRYMSPEQAGGQPVGPASDLYSLGIVLYEMLSGAPPYDPVPGRSAMIQHLMDPVVPLTARGVAVTPPVAALTERLLAKEPTERFATTDELMSALDAVTRSGSGAAAMPTGRAAASAAARPAWRRRGWMAVAAVAVVAVAAYFVSRPVQAAEDPRHSLLIGYFENTSRDPDLEWLRVGGIELLNRSLSRWTDIQLVETTRLLDLARRADLAEGATMSQDDALRLARDAGVGTVALGSVLRLGAERSSVTLRLYDVETGSSLRQLSEEVATDSLLPRAFARLADEVLSIAGAPNGAIPADEPPTRSLAAFRVYVEGLRAIHRWQLDSARSLLEAAVREDPAFALAWMRMGEASLWRDGPFVDSAPWERLTDSAMAHIGGRPAREQLLVETVHHFMHGRFADTRRLAQRLIADDSASVDGWYYLGLASFLDQYAVPDAAGRDSTGFDPTTSLRAMRRASTLDASNHQSYVWLASLLSILAVERVSVPTGRFGVQRYESNELRPPVARGISEWPLRLVMVSPDSIAMGPLAEMNERITPAMVDASLRLARAQLREIVGPWLATAPEEGVAHLMHSLVLEADGDWSGALAAYNRAEALDAPLGPVSPDWERLRLALAGRLDSSMLVTTERLEARGEDPMARNLPWLLGSLAAAHLMQGRLEEARTGFERAQFLTDSGPRVNTRNQALVTYNRLILEARLRSYPGRLTAAGYEEQEALVRRAVTTLPDSMHPRTAVTVLVPLGFPAAYLGDTARVARLRATLPEDRRALYPGLDALAAAAAGDRARAEAALRAVDTDTLFPWPGSEYAAGAAALLLGDGERALRHFTRVDSSAFTIQSIYPDADWIFVTRAAKGRGDAALMIGDTARAIREYERVLTLWAKADPVFDAERRDVTARLTRISGGDRTRTRPVPTRR